jgi:hypothetical protein
MFIVCPHAVATFIVGKGYDPLDVEFRGMSPVYLFRDDAQAVIASYNNAKLLLAAMVEHKRPGVAK